VSPAFCTPGRARQRLQKPASVHADLLHGRMFCAGGSQISEQHVVGANSQIDVTQLPENCAEPFQLPRGE